jgi:cell division protein FtsW (lipid II flippase)
MISSNRKKLVLLVCLWLPIVFYPFGGLVMFSYTLVICISSIYVFFLAYKDQQYISIIASAASVLLFCWVALYPYEHISLPFYIEKNGVKIKDTHKHYYWENAHVHYECITKHYQTTKRIKNYWQPKANQ